MRMNVEEDDAIQNINKFFGNKRYVILEKKKCWGRREQCLLCLHLLNWVGVLDGNDNFQVIIQMKAKDDFGIS